MRMDLGIGLQSYSVIVQNTQLLNIILPSNFSQSIALAQVLNTIN